MKQVVNTYIKKRQKELNSKFRKVNTKLANEKASVILNLSDRTHRISVIKRNDEYILQELILYSDFKMIAECIYMEVIS